MGEKEDANASTLKVKEIEVGSKNLESNCGIDSMRNKEDNDSSDKDEGYHKGNNHDNEEDTDEIEVEIYGLNVNNDQLQETNEKAGSRNSLASTLTKQSVNLDEKKRGSTLQKSITRRRSKHQISENGRSPHKSQKEDNLSTDINKEKL